MPCQQLTFKGPLLCRSVQGHQSCKSPAQGHEHPRLAARAVTTCGEHLNRHEKQVASHWILGKRTCNVAQKSADFDGGQHEWDRRKGGSGKLQARCQEVADLAYSPPTARDVHVVEVAWLPQTACRQNELRLKSSMAELE